MKKIIVSVLLLMFFACGTDSDDEIDNTITQDNLVSKIVTSSFLLGNPETINTKTYINNIPTVDSIYNVSNDIWIYINYIYENDKLVRREANTQGSNQVEELIINYDDLGRIIQTDELTNSFTSTTTFTYENQAIISETNLNGNITTKVFHLNDDGIIFKEVNTDETIEVLYDEGYNVVSFNSSTMPPSSYTYDNTILPPDNFQFFRNFMLGAYKNNQILFENNIGGAGFSDIAIVPKYHLSVTNANFSHTFEWTFNSNDYPISRKTFDENNHLTFQIGYFYD